MIDDMTSSDDKLNSRTHFACLACHSKTPVHDHDEADFGREGRQRFVRYQIDARRGNRQSVTTRLSSAYVLEEAAKRHFELMHITTEKLRNKKLFSNRDFRFLMDANRSPVWSVNCRFTLSGSVLSEYGIDDIEDVDDITDKDLRSLIKKLNSLTAAETLAVAEACELVMRGYDNPLL